MGVIYKNGIQYGGGGSSNANNISITVGSDTINLKLLIQTLIKNFATLATNPTTSAYAIDDYITYKGQLYKVTSAIASGDTLTIGTNIVAIGIMDAIDEYLCSTSF